MQDLIKQIESKKLTIEQALQYTYSQGKQDADNEKLTIWKLEERLKQDLDSAREEILESQYPEDLISEYVDSAIPIRNHDLAQMLASDITLGVVDDWGILEGSVEDLDVFRLLKVTIYERLSPIGYEWLEANRGE